MMLSVCVFPIWGSHSCITGVTINKHQEGKQLYICASLYSLQPCVSMLRLLFKFSRWLPVFPLILPRRVGGRLNQNFFFHSLPYTHLLGDVPIGKRSTKYGIIFSSGYCCWEMASDQGWTAEMKRRESMGWSDIHRPHLGNLIVIRPNSYFHIWYNLYLPAVAISEQWFV